MAEVFVGDPVSVTDLEALASLNITVASSDTTKFLTATAVLVDGITVTDKLLSGTPTVPGTVSVDVEKRDGFNRQTKGTYTLTVVEPAAADPEPVEPVEEPQVPADLPAAVVAFLGLQGNDQALALATQHVRVVTTFVRAYTRGEGFTAGVPNVDLEDVIVSATARLVVNPQQATRQQVGAQSVNYASLEGFTLAEKAVLNLYRRRTA